MFGENKACRAALIASLSMSVAKIWIGGGSLSRMCSRVSFKTMVRLKVSSPVEQAGVQIRIGASLYRDLIRSGRAFSLRYSKRPGSRKKFVTPINNSLYKRLTSWGFSCK